MTNAKVIRPAAFQRAPVAPSKAKTGARPRATRTYLVRYTWIGGEIEREEFRLRCPQLTKGQLVSQGALVGEIAERRGVKWSGYSAGSLPATAGQGSRVILEIGDGVDEG